VTDVVGYSAAGTLPGKALNPVVGEALKEVDIDSSNLFPKPITAEVADGASLVVALGCDTSDPHLKGKPTIHWDIPDAKGKNLEEIREIRDNVSKLVDGLIKDLGLTASPEKH